MTREQEIQELINIKFKATWLRFENNFNHYSVLLKTDQGQATFPYFQGTGIKDQPDLVSVLYCLISDAQAAINNDSVSFCNEFGYPERQGTKVFKNCERIYAKLEKLGIADYLNTLHAIYQDY